MIAKAKSSPLDYPQFGSTSASIGALLAAVKEVIQWTLAAINETMKICFGEIHEAMQIARAAEACARAGSIDQGVEISMDMDQLLYDAGRLHDAICLMNRIKGH